MLVAKTKGYYIKESDANAPAMNIWGMQITLSFPLLPGPLWPRIVAPYRALSMGRIRGARGELVIVVGNGHGETSSNSGRD